MKAFSHLKLVPPSTADSNPPDETPTRITVEVVRDSTGFAYAVEEDGAVLEVLPSAADVAVYIEAHLAYVTTGAGAP